MCTLWCSALAWVVDDDEVLEVFGRMHDESVTDSTGWACL
jgi:hypothetical protein